MFLLRYQQFLIIGYQRLRRQRRIAAKKQKHNSWVTNIFLERERRGHFHTIFQELKLNDREYFSRYL